MKWWILIVAALIVITVGSLVFTFFYWPKATLAYLSRQGLKKAGAELFFVNAPRGKMGYWKVGSGPTVALLHGAGDQAGTWVKLVPELSKHYRLLMVDFPGHEKSEPFEGPLHHGDMADALEALLDHEAPDEKVVLVGNSMGGWTALLYAHNHPGRVKALVLEDSGGVSGPDLREALAPKTREEALELFERSFGPDMPEIKSYVLDDLIRRTKTGPIPRMLATDTSPYLLDGKLGNVEAPAHLVWGEHDGLLPLDYAEKLAAELPRSRLHVLEGCGHLPHLQKPAAFREILKRILDDPEAMLNG